MQFIWCDSFAVLCLGATLLSTVRSALHAARGRPRNQRWFLAHLLWHG